MDLAGNTDTREERWHRSFVEFQELRSLRNERKAAARNEFDAEQQELHAAISHIRDDQNQSIEAIQGEADEDIRQLEEQTNIKIKQLQDEAYMKATEIKEDANKKIEGHQATTARQRQELEEKLTTRKRKYESDDGLEIEDEFIRHLEKWEMRLTSSTLPDTPPSSEPREPGKGNLPFKNHSTVCSSLRRPGSHEEQENQAHQPLTFNSLPLLRSSEQHVPASQVTHDSDTPTRTGKKRQFLGFAKDGCITCRKRLWRCDENRPTCGICETDGQPCVWPPSEAENQSASEDSNDPQGDNEESTAVDPRPSTTEYFVEAGFDLSPAFYYDARNPPSQRLPELTERNTEAGSSCIAVGDPRGSLSGPGDSGMGQSLSMKPLQRPRSKRSGKPSGILTAQKTISFDEVFRGVQSVDSREKHFIVEFPPGSEKWYILRCVEHDMNFGARPLNSAGQHIDSFAHGHKAKTNENAIAELGELVQGCDAKRAERNNEAYTKILQNGYRPKTGKRKRRRKTAALDLSKRHRARSNPGRHGSRPAEPSKPFEGIVNPVPGEVYQGAQQTPGSRELHWYLVVRLPLDDWQCVGINGSFHQNGLSQSTPKCYQREVLDDSQPGAPEWAEEFRTGGSRVKERKFLCLLLKPGLEIPPWGEDFILPPGKQYLSWLDAGSLRDRWYRHPHTIHPGSTKDVEDAHDVARKFCRRLEAARAACRGRRPSTPMSNLHSGQTEQNQASRHAAGQNEVDNGRKQTSEADEEQRQQTNDHEFVQDKILVASSSALELEASRSPGLSMVDDDDDNLESSYSPGSIASATRSPSGESSVLDENFDIGDYNAPPRLPISSPDAVQSESSKYERAEPLSASSDGLRESSAVEGLRAIQAEFIPKYRRNGIESHSPESQRS